MRPQLRLEPGPDAPQPLAFGHQPRQQLPATRQESPEFLGGGSGQRPGSGLDDCGEAGQQLPNGRGHQSR